MAKKKGDMPSGGIWDQPLAPGGVPGVTPGPSTTKTQRDSKPDYSKYAGASKELAAWLWKIGITPEEWKRFPSSVKEDRRRDFEASEKQPYGVNVDGDFGKWLKAAGYGPGEWWRMKQSQRTALRETWKMSPEKAAADAAEVEGLGIGAEAMVSDPGFFEFVPPVFMEASEKFANVTMDAWAQETLGRRLRPDERARAIAAWRKNEKRLYASEVREQRAAHAQNVLGTAEPFGGGKGKPADELLQMGVQVPDSATEKEALKRLKSFEKFSPEDFEIAMGESIAALSPKEEFGVELRGAFEGLLQALKGRVSAERFAP